MTRLLLLSNVLGDELFLSHVLEEGRRSGVDAVLACGDLGGDRAWPVHPEADDADRAFLERRGFLPFKVDADAFDEFSRRLGELVEMRSSAEDVASLESLFTQGAARLESSGFRARSLASVLGRLERFSADAGVPCMAVMGSGDVDGVAALMDEAAARTPSFHPVHGSCAPLGDLAVVGLGRVVATDTSASAETMFTRSPGSFFSALARARPRAHRRAAGPGELSEREAARLLDLGSRRAGRRPIVLLAHTPPFASGADLVVSEEGQVHATGSSAVRAFATRGATRLVHTGHVRHCSGVTRIGDTLVVNTGQVAGLERPLVNVRNVVDEVASTYVPVAIWEPVGGMAAIAEVAADRTCRASPIIVREHVEDDQA